MNGQLIKRKDAKTQRRGSGTITAIAFCTIVLAVFMVGCNRKASYKFSNVYNGGFDPEKVLREQGLSVKPAPGNGDVTNPVYGYAWRKWQGTIAAFESNPWEAVPGLWRDALSKTAGSQVHVEFPSSDRRKVGEPFTGLLMYNKDEMHGEMHIWLIPDEGGKSVGYVIFLREEPLIR